MAITRDDVLHVAALARLDLTEDEIARLEVQLNDRLRCTARRLTICARCETYIRRRRIPPSI